jgi:hypothetical protein
MSTVASNTSVFTNREFPFKRISLSESLEKRNRKYYIDYTIENQPIFFQINKVVLSSEPIFIDDEQGYVDVEIKDRLTEISKFFEELDNFNQISCFKNCEEWLGKNITMSEIESVYKSSFKNNLLRLKIERDNIRIFDYKKNKLNLEKDIKVGDVLDVIVEISGLKVMKNAFATQLVLRQIRKHPDPVPSRTKTIPTEYLFLDDYSNRNIGKKMRDEISLDSQTDVDVLVSQRKKPAVIKTKPVKREKQERSEITETKEKVESVSLQSGSVDINDIDISLSDLKDAVDIENLSEHILHKKKSPATQNIKNIDTPNNKGSFDIEKEDEDTKEYLESVEKLKNIMTGIFDSSSVASKSTTVSNVSRKDKILEKLDNGELTLGSMISSQSEKPLKKAPGGRKKATKVNKTEQELFKNL